MTVHALALIGRDSHWPLLGLIGNIRWRKHCRSVFTVPGRQYVEPCALQRFPGAMRSQRAFITNFLGLGKFFNTKGSPNFQSVRLLAICSNASCSLSYPHQALHTCTGSLAKNRNTYCRANNGKSVGFAEMAMPCYAVEEKGRADQPSFACHPVSEHGIFHSDRSFQMNSFHWPIHGP